METVYFLLGIVIVLAAAGVIGVLIAFSKLKQLKQEIISFEHNIEHIHRIFDEIHNKINNTSSEIYRHIDSRLDKLESKLTSKKLIKG